MRTILAVLPQYEKIYSCSNWKVTEKSPKYQNYLDFVTNISSLNYKNMERLEAFMDDEDLNSADFLDIALQMKIDIPLTDRNIFTNVITEAS